MKKKKEKKLDSISLIVPAHNSASVISPSIKKYSVFLSKLARKYEIIVVCNACTDNTEQLALKMAKKDKRIKVLSIKERGKGFAVLKGFNIARNEIIGFLDADCVFNLDKIKEMIFHLDNYDCVIASKWLGRNVLQIPESFTRKILAVGWKALIIFLFHMRFHDTQAGAKFLKKKAFERIGKKFTCIGFDFDVELLYKLKKKGLSVKEVYTPIVKTYKFSTFRIRFVPGMFWRIFKLWVHSI